MPPEEQRRAFVSLLSTDSYLRGVQCLARGLRAARSRFPLIVMTTGSVSDASVDALRAEPNVEVRAVEYVRVPSEARAVYACAHFADCYSKLHAWGWLDYAQLCYLDADMLPRESLDELLTTDVPEGVPLLAVPECACRQRAMRAACPYAPNPSSARLVRRYFNAGLIVFRPSAHEHARILRALASADAAALPFAEQDLLNRLYAGEWLPLSPHYNATKGLWLHHRRRLAPATRPSAAAPAPCEPTAASASGEPTAAPAGCELMAARPFFELDLKEVRNLHFTMAKPWQLRDPLNRGFGALNQLWWDAFLRGRPGAGGGGGGGNGGGGNGGVGTLNKVCAVLAIRAKAAGAATARERAARAERRAAAPAAAEPPRGALPSDSESDASADSSEDELAARAAEADGGAGAGDGGGGADALSAAALAAADAAVLEAERWCLVRDEPAGHLCVPCLPREAASDSEGQSAPEPSHSDST